MLSEEKKEKIEREILELVAEALQKRAITSDDTSKIATFVLDKIESVENHDELIGFLAELSHKWPLFQTIVDLEKGKMESERDQTRLAEILHHLDSGSIENAIEVANKSQNHA